MIIALFVLAVLFIVALVVGFIGLVNDAEGPTVLGGILAAVFGFVMSILLIVQFAVEM